MAVSICEHVPHHCANSQIFEMITHVHKGEPKLYPNVYIILIALASTSGIPKSVERSLSLYTARNFATVYEITRQVYKELTGRPVASDAHSHIKNVAVFPEPFKCPHMEGMTCVGFIRLNPGKEKAPGKATPPMNAELLITAERCLPDSSFAHELTHLFTVLTLGDLDSDHTDPLLWGEKGVVKLSNAIARSMPGMCPSEL